MQDKRMSGGDRKEKILSKVAPLFCDKGINVTSKELSEAAGVSEALIYKHFHSKSDLYKAFLQKCCNAHQSIGLELTQLGASTEVLVCATHLLIHLKTYGSNSTDSDFTLSAEQHRSLVLQSLQTDGELARTMFSIGLGPWVKYFVECMNAAEKSGDIENTIIPKETLAWLTHHSVLGVRMTRHPVPHSFMVDNVSDEQLIIDMLVYTLRGMGVKQSAIKRVFKSKEYEQFKKKLKNNQGENK